MSGVLVAVLSFRETEMTRACVASVGGSAPVVVLDNGARPERDGLLEDALPGVEVVRWRENRPFADAVDATAQHAEGKGYERLLFLTNDVTLDAGAFDALEAALRQDPGLAAVGPVQVHADRPDTVFHAGGGFDFRRWSSLVLDGGEPLAGLPQMGLRPVDWLDGAAVLYRLEAYRAVGPMWPDYEFYWEDSDWGLRAGAAGFGLGVAFWARVLHRTSATAGAFSEWKRDLLWRNRLLSARRLAGADWPRLRRYFLVSALSRVARSPFDRGAWRRLSLTRAVLAGETPLVERPSELAD